MKVPSVNLPPMKNPISAIPRPSLQGMSIRGIQPFKRSSRESWNSSSVQCGTENPPSNHENRLYTPDDIDLPDPPRPISEKAESEIKSIYSLDNEPNPLDEPMQFDEPDLEATILDIIRCYGLQLLGYRT